MQYYADVKAERAMQAIVSRAENVMREAEAAIDAAQKVIAAEPGPDRDEAQAEYDSHFDRVRSLAEGLHDAATKLP